VQNSVTSFTMSDFSRTFQPNSNTGSDHAWGAHHIVMGGAVKGGAMYKTFPTLALSGPDDSGTHGRWVPSTGSVQYAATLASWFGSERGPDAGELPEYRQLYHNKSGIRVGDLTETADQSLWSRPDNVRKRTEQMRRRLSNGCGTRSPKTTYQWWKSAAAGASPSQWKVVAARQDSPRANRDESKRTDKQYEQKPRQAQHEGSLTRKTRRNRVDSYVTDLTEDRNFGEGQLCFLGLRGKQSEGETIDLCIYLDLPLQFVTTYGH